MNKQSFLKELEISLAHLSPEERDDILRDMEEHFHEAEKRGQSEAETIKKLGSPKIIAETISAEQKVKKIDEANTIPQKIRALFGALFAILLLTPFNLIFVLLPLFLVTLFFIIGWPIVFAIIISLPIVFILGIMMSIHVGLQIFALLSILFFALGWLGFVIALSVGFFYLTLFYFKAIAKLLQWNIQFVKNHMKG